MTTSEISIPRLSDAEHRVQLRRAVVAGTVGTIIHAYDFLLYVQVAPLRLAKLYFPSSDLMVLLFSWIAGDQFLDWRWRVPFWLSIVMVGIGLYIRLGIYETPIFTRMVEERRVERTPVIEVLRRQPKLVGLTALARTGQQG